MQISYETIARLSQLSTLFFFIAFFLGVLLYVFWPANRQKFDALARQPLNPDPKASEIGGRDGR